MDERGPDFASAASGGSSLDRERMAADERLVRGRFWNKVRETLGRVPFLEEAVAAYYCATDQATPLHVKAVLLGALAYFIVPTDMIPDFIAGLGYTDDAAVLYAALRVIRPHVGAHHRARARDVLDRLRG